MFGIKKIIKGIFRKENEIKKLSTEKLLKMADEILEELAKRHKLEDCYLNDLMVCKWYLKYGKRVDNEKGFV